MVAGAGEGAGSAAAVFAGYGLMPNGRTAAGWFELDAGLLGALSVEALVPAQAARPATATAAAEPAAAPPPASAARPQQGRRPQAGYRGTTQVAAPSAPPDDPELTPEQQVYKFKGQCWMDTEKQRTADIDKRIALVDKCVAAKMKAIGAN